ncbi:MAG: TetR/AcrR family transcriptional regulator [Thermodesulfobacteriota bacterium]
MTNPASPADPRGEILAASLALFSQRGYFQTSMQDVRKSSGVSIGAIYHYFKNKEEIALALYHSLLDKMSRMVEENLAGHHLFHDRCYGILEDLFQESCRAPAAMQFLLYARHREFLPALQPICSARPFELMLIAAGEAMDRGEVRRMEPVVMVATIFGSPLRLILLHTEGLLEKKLEEYLPSTWSCIWPALKNDTPVAEG